MKLSTKKDINTFFLNQFYNCTLTEKCLSVGDGKNI